MGIQQMAHALDIIVGSDQRVLDDVLRHTSARCLTKGSQPRACRDEEGIGMAVVAALELDDLISPREATCQTDGTHRRLRPRVHHAHTLYRGEELRANKLCHLDLTGITSPVARTLLQLTADSLLDGRVSVPEEQGPPGADVVDVFIAIDVKDVGALAVIDIEGGEAYRAEGTHRAIDSAGDVSGGALEERSRCIGSSHTHIYYRCRCHRDATASTWRTSTTKLGQKAEGRTTAKL